MRILIFSTAYFPHVGGAEVAVKEITDRVSDVSFDMVTIRLDKKDAKQETIGNIKVYRIGWGLGKIDKLLFPFRAARFANKLHKKNKYNIAWSIMASYSGFAALFFKKKNPEVKFLLTLQEGDDLAQVEKKVWLVKKWFKQIFTEADHIQCISSYLADWAKTKNIKCPIEVVPNGVQVTNNKEQVTNIKDDLGIEESEKVILTTSRLVAKNGIDFLIKATEMLTNNSIHNKHNVKLVICGDGEDRKKLEERVKELDIADKVIFTGFIQPNKLAQYYAIADVFCRPSESEGLGNSFLEAMGAGVPIIGTPVGGIPDFLKDKETGYFCKVKDPASITEKIKYILNLENKEEVNAAKVKAKNLVKSFYNWRVIGIQMKNIFNNVITSEAK